MENAITGTTDPGSEPDDREELDVRHSLAVVVLATTQLASECSTHVLTYDTVSLHNRVNPFNVSCSKLLQFEGFSAILV